MSWISWMTISGAIKSTQRMRVVSNKSISLHFVSGNRRVPFNLQSGQPLRQFKSIDKLIDTSCVVDEPNTPHTQLTGLIPTSR